jgi:hypothetical protein
MNVTASSGPFTIQTMHVRCRWTKPRVWLSRSSCPTGLHADGRSVGRSGRSGVTSAMSRSSESIDASCPLCRSVLAELAPLDAARQVDSPVAVTSLPTASGWLPAVAQPAPLRGCAQDSWVSITAALCPGGARECRSSVPPLTTALAQASPHTCLPKRVCQVSQKHPYR